MINALITALTHIVALLEGAIERKHAAADDLIEKADALYDTAMEHRKAAAVGEGLAEKLKSIL